MSLKFVLFPLIILSGLFHPGTPIIFDLKCYIFDHIAAKAGAKFWDHIPHENCRGTIYVVQDISNYNLTTMKTYFEDNQWFTLLELGVKVTNNNANSVANIVCDLAYNYFSRLHIIWDDGINKDTKVAAEEDIFKTCNGVKISRAVTCSPDSNPPVKEHLLETNYFYAYTMLQVKLEENGIDGFINQPETCVEFVSNKNVPNWRTSIGLSMVSSKNIKYREVCTTQQGQKLLDVGESLFCKNKYNHVMLWGLSDDDYSGTVCGNEPFPLLTHYAEMGEKCPPTKEIYFADAFDGGEAMRPIMVLYTICFVAVSLLF